MSPTLLVHVKYIQFVYPDELRDSGEGFSVPRHQAVLTLCENPSISVKVYIRVRP
jgi:hypothetical protein